MRQTLLNLKYTPILLLLALFSSCVGEEEYANDPHGNLEALWHIVDEHYCFFGDKAEAFGLDWNAVHEKYAARVDADMTETQLFEVLGDMLSELRDGHVNMYSRWDVARNWSWHEDYPSNLSDTVLSRYLGTDYRMASGMKYRILDDNVGYLRCTSLANSLGAGNLDEIMLYLAPCEGLILDVRDNGGGLIASAEQLAARFTNEEILVGYMRHKTGRGHDDFSAMEEQRLKPARGLRWQKPVVVLTNRAVFSAANELVKYLRCCPRVTTVGDRTGGGAGMPFSSELPIGWSIRFSACPMYDREGRSTEDGIAPDHAVALSDGDVLRGEDTLIEYARRLLHGRGGAR